MKDILTTTGVSTAMYDCWRNGGVVTIDTTDSLGFLANSLNNGWSLTSPSTDFKFTARTSSYRNGMVKQKFKSLNTDIFTYIYSGDTQGKVTISPDNSILGAMFQKRSTNATRYPKATIDAITQQQKYDIADYALTYDGDEYCMYCTTDNGVVFYKNNVSQTLVGDNTNNATSNVDISAKVSFAVWESGASGSDLEFMLEYNDSNSSAKQVLTFTDTAAVTEGALESMSMYLRYNYLTHWQIDEIQAADISAGITDFEPIRFEQALADFNSRFITVEGDVFDWTDILYSADFDTIVEALTDGSVASGAFIGEKYLKIEEIITPQAYATAQGQLYGSTLSINFGGTTISNPEGEVMKGLITFGGREHVPALPEVDVTTSRASRASFASIASQGSIASQAATYYMSSSGTQASTASVASVASQASIGTTASAGAVASIGAVAGQAIEGLRVTASETTFHNNFARIGDHTPDFENLMSVAIAKG